MTVSPFPFCVRLPFPELFRVESLKRDQAPLQPRFSPHALAMLRSLPRTTFGHQWLADWEGQRSSDLNHPIGNRSLYYASLRVLTGYGPDTMGTAELCAFLLGCQTDPRSAAVNLNRLLALIWPWLTHPGLPDPNPSHTKVWSRLHCAYRRGRRSWFALHDWQPQSLSDLPLEYVRRWFHISAENGDSDRS
ncbi:MAG: hypothetical protein AB4042_17195 [Leptolyngbyaceae cyanobacterium]